MATVEDKRNLFLLKLLLFLTFDLMLLGAGVRTMDAGLTCPDWPLCFGKIIPDYHFGVYLEFIHRVIAGFVAILFALLFYWIYRDPSKKHLRFWLWVSLFLLLSQIIMGGLTVLKLLDFIIVTIHLSLATLFLMSLTVIHYIYERPITLSQRELNGWNKVLLRGTLVIMGSIGGQIILGGLVASTYSGMVCVDFPTCGGQWFPALQGAVGFQMFHRFGAYTLTILLSVLFFFVIFKKQEMQLNQKVRAIYVQSFFLIWTQVGVGILNIKSLIPAWLSVIHLGLALYLLLTVTKAFFSYSMLLDQKK